ncbi:MAG: cell division protein FtsZ [Acidobacteria bacterium]|nr:MAG: cell division protein FtsZ [Acidobacteriota bacterium]
MNQNRVKFFLDEPEVLGAKIKVIGVGGAGGNAINHMIESGMKGVEFVAINTDIQDLIKSKAQIKLQIGSQLTRGLGAGSDPNVGKQAAIEDANKIIDVLEGSDMVFVTAGLGGGTGTGAAPVITSLAVELDILTVAVVTKPFTVEGLKKMKQAEQGVAELRLAVDTLLVIPNSKLKEIEQNITTNTAFQRANDVLLQAVSGISDLITETGLINLDFADVRAVMKGMGVAVMGVGAIEGEKAAVKAMKLALDSKLLEDNSINGAKGVLINFTYGNDIPLNDIEEALQMVHNEVDPEANIIFGLVNRPAIKDQVKVTLIATGFDRHLMDSKSTQEEINTTIKPHDYRWSYPRSEEKKQIEEKKFVKDDLGIPTFIRRQAD